MAKKLKFKNGNVYDYKHDCMYYQNSQEIEDTR